MLTKADKDTVAAILGPGWEDFLEAGESRAAEDEKAENDVDTPGEKPKQ